MNIDCGARAWAFDRIQVDALVRMITAEARMVECEFGELREFALIKDPHILRGGYPSFDVSTLRPARWAPTRCRGLSDSTARLGLRSCVATNNRHSPLFERG